MGNYDIMLPNDITSDRCQTKTKSTHPTLRKKKKKRKKKTFARVVSVICRDRLWRLYIHLLMQGIVLASEDFKDDFTTYLKANML